MTTAELDIDAFDPMSGDFLPRTHSWYPGLIERGVFAHPGAGYSLFRWDDVRAALLDWETFSNLPTPGGEAFMGGETEFVGLLDPPEQTRLRKLMGKALSLSWVRSLERDMAAIAAAVVDEALERDDVDFFADVTKEFVGRVIVQLMHGLPPENVPYYFDTSLRVVGAFGYSSFLPTDHPLLHEKAEIAMASNAEYMEHVTAIVDERRSHPSDDLISRLVGAEAGGDRLTPKQVAIMARDLNIGALDTTACTAAALALRLHENPDEDRLLRQRPDLVPEAGEEALRFDGAARQAFRRATRTVEYHGTVIPEGAEVILWLAAAAVDPAANDDPLAFRIERAGRNHLAFAMGPHTCPGLQLAKRELNVLWTALLDKTSAIEIDQAGVEWYPSPHIHGPCRLPARLTPR